MPVINVTKADLLKTKVYDAGWYPARIAKVGALEKSADGNSINCRITFALGGGAEGKEIDNTFNSKLWGMLDPLHQAVFGKAMDEGSFDTDTLLGKDCDVSLVVDTYKGNLQNKIAGYLPKGKGGQAQPF